MEIVGEWAGKHKDTDIWDYFDQHWRHLFPDLSSRSKFVNQSANLWNVKQKIQQRLIQLMHADNADIHLIDGFPIDVCHRRLSQNSSP